VAASRSAVVLMEPARWGREESVEEEEVL
jgi:hypothetical protein